MISSSRAWTWRAGPAAVAVALAVMVPLCLGAEPPDPAGVPQGPYRQLAPGVLKSVEPPLDEADTVSRHDMVELVAVDPDLDWAKDVPFRRKIWYLDFQFKPVRMIHVDVPQPDGRMKRKLIWYMVYSVTNPGKTLPSQEGPDGTLELQKSDEPILFTPAFRLKSLEFDTLYPDRVIPVAMGPIRMREDPNRQFLTTVEMAREIKVGQTLWGVATWEDLDPRIDFFCIFVSGLTNAYRWEDPPGAFQPGDPPGKGRQWARKTLRLNFWRPGDEHLEHEQEIRFGIPGEVDYEWVYR